MADTSVSKADADRSVYSALFESRTSTRESKKVPESVNNTAMAMDDYTLVLPEWPGDQTSFVANSDSATRHPAAASTPPMSQDAHKDYAEALYTMGRNETFLIDPEPLVKRFTDLSKDFEGQLRDLMADHALGPNETRELVEFFHNEKFTWKLVWALLLAAQGNDSAVNMEDLAALRLPNSDAEEIDEFFDSSFDFRKMQTLVDWLEHRYGEEKSLSNSASLHAFKEHGEMYEATKHAILSNRANTDVITELDPDAPIRQQRVIHEQDIEDEQRFYRCVFELVRAGRLTEAQKLAMDQGHFMLAAGMEGWKTFRSNIRDENGNLMPDEGNPYRDVWKTVVWKKLADDRVNVAERAIYAALSGCLDALLPLCSSWEDHLWAHLKTMVDVAIELHLRNARGADIGRLPEEYPKENESLDTVLKNLENSTDLNANEFFRQLHKFLMLQDAKGLLQMMFDSCVKVVDEDNRSSQKPSQQLRLMANLALFLRYYRQDAETRLDGDEDPVNYIVAFYVDRLISEGVYEVIPKYVLHLPDRLREQCYLRLLRSLRDPTHELRQAILESAQREHIDIYKYLTKFVYETIHKEEDGQATNPNEIGERDLEKIDALKWLFVQRGHSLLGLVNVNCALRSAVLAKRLQVAAKLISLVPTEAARDLALLVVERGQDTTSDHGDGGSRAHISRTSSAEMEYTEADSVSDDDLDPLKCKRALKEYFCFQVYVEAQHSFTEWFEHFHRNKPKPVDQVQGNHSSARSKLTAEFAQKAIETRLEAWQTVLNSLCDRTSGHLYSILSYQDGGFLQDPNEPEGQGDTESDRLDMDARRLEEMRALRRICIPEVVSLLHTVLHGTGRYAEDIEIANLVAGEALCLYKEFSREDMAALLVKLQESSLELLKVSGTDPYGFEDN